MQHDTFDRILAILCSVLDAYSAVLFLPLQEGEEENGKGNHYIAASFSLGNRVDLYTTVPEGRGLVGWILRNKEPLLVANFDQRQNHLGYYVDNEEQTIKAFMGCPLHGARGALCLDSKRQYSFSEKDQKMLHLFADLVSQLQTEKAGQQKKDLTAKFYAALRAVYFLRQTHTRWADFLHNFFDLLLSVTGFTYATLCTLDAGHESFSVEGESSPLLWKNGAPPSSFPLSAGLVGWVFRNGTSVITGGAEGAPETQLVGKPCETPQFQSLMAMPLVIQRRTRGVLCLGSEAPMPTCDMTSDFVRMATEHLSLFLENLYVKSHLRDMHRQMQSSPVA